MSPPVTRGLAGASYHPVLRASPADVPARVAEQVAAVLASDFPARARAIAAEIAETAPDVVGLQEACLFELPGSGSARMALRARGSRRRVLLGSLTRYGSSEASRESRTPEAAR